LSSSDKASSVPDEDRLLPLGQFSPRQEAVSYLLRMALPAPIVNIMDQDIALLIKRTIEEHVVDGQHWMQAHGDRLRRIEIEETNVDTTVLFILECSSCHKDAVFTAEGPNDEYPDPLCEKCEAGEE